MKRLLLTLLLASQAFAADEWMKFPYYGRTVLTNGVTLLLVEQHDAPLINLNLALRSGSTQDPAGKEGLADVTNDLLRKGAGGRNADQIAEDLDFIGATLGTTVSLEITRIHTEFLKKDLATGLDLFSDLVLHPKFPAAEVKKALQQRVDELKAQKDDPRSVIGNYYKRFLFGSHPYGRPASGDERSIPAIKRNDIVRFHQQTYVAENMIIIVCGDFKSEEMEKQLAARFGSLPRKSISQLPVPMPSSVSGDRLLLVDKPDATQTFYRIGSLGTAVNDPDRLTIDLVNTLFGGRFTSRLNTALRIDRGLTYGASSGFERLREPGSFFIGSFTKNATTEEAIQMTLKVLKTLRDEGITEAEFASAKSYLKGQFGPKVETPDQIAERLAYCEIYGLDPKVEVDQYAARLDAITLAETRRVIRKAYPATNFVYTLVGKAAEIESVVKKLSPAVTTLPITTPGFGGK